MNFRVLAGVYMSSVDVCVDLLEIPVCCVLYEKRPNHEFDGNIIVVLVLLRLTSLAFK